MMDWKNYMLQQILESNQAMRRNALLDDQIRQIFTLQSMLNGSSTPENNNNNHNNDNIRNYMEMLSSNRNDNRNQNIRGYIGMPSSNRNDDRNSNYNNINQAHSNLLSGLLHQHHSTQSESSTDSTILNQQQQLHDKPKIDAQQQRKLHDKSQIQLPFNPAFTNKQQSHGKPQIDAQQQQQIHDQTDIYNAKQQKINEQAISNTYKLIKMKNMDHLLVSPQTKSKFESWIRVNVMQRVSEIIQIINEGQAAFLQLLISQNL